MSNEPDPERLKALDEKLKKLKGEENGTNTGGADLNQANMAWQMVIELVSGLAIGFGIGYGIDAVFGTKPIFMVLFILLGFAAGVKVMLGTAAQMQKNQEGEAPSDKEEG